MYDGGGVEVETSSLVGGEQVRIGESGRGRWVVRGRGGRACLRRGRVTVRERDGDGVWMGNVVVEESLEVVQRTGFGRGGGWARRRSTPEGHLTHPRWWWIVLGWDEQLHWLGGQHRRFLFCERAKEREDRTILNRISALLGPTHPCRYQSKQPPSTPPPPLILYVSRYPPSVTSVVS